MAQKKAKSEQKLQYDCTNCLAYCCSIYECVVPNRRDLKRLAKHFGLTVEEFLAQHTDDYRGARILKRKPDPILGECCAYLDTTTRGCMVYNARPQSCRDYPSHSTGRCAYYDVLQYEREAQNDSLVTPLVQITFRVENKQSVPSAVADRSQNING